jgi:hypothetical protein
MGKVLHPKLFPFCVPKGTITSGSFIAVSLEEAMNIYWKVRRMSYVFEYISSSPIYTEIVQGKIQRSRFYYGGYDPLVSEEYLVCTNSTPVYWSYDATQTLIFLNETLINPIPNYQFNLENLGVIFLWSEMVQSDGTFYIPIDLYVSLGDNEPATYTLNYAGGNPPEEEFPTTINIFGYSIQALYWKFFDPGFAPIEITINPLEYWSYDGAWDTSTGLPLT